MVTPAEAYAVAVATLRAHDAKREQLAAIARKAAANLRNFKIVQLENRK